MERLGFYDLKRLLVAGGLAGASALSIVGCGSDEQQPTALAPVISLKPPVESTTPPVSPPAGQGASGESAAGSASGESEDLICLGGFFDKENRTLILLPLVQEVRDIFLPQDVRYRGDGASRIDIAQWRTFSEGEYEWVNKDGTFLGDRPPECIPAPELNFLHVREIGTQTLRVVLADNQITAEQGVDLSTLEAAWNQNGVFHIIFQASDRESIEGAILDLPLYREPTVPPK